jgi:hypothetical protein
VQSQERELFTPCSPPIKGTFYPTCNPKLRLDKTYYHYLSSTTRDIILRDRRRGHGTNYERSSVAGQEADYERSGWDTWLIMNDPKKGITYPKVVQYRGLEIKIIKTPVV